MKIGIDIDNRISNIDDVLLKEYLKHDNELGNTGIINENPEYLRIGMFDWTDDEEYYNICITHSYLNNDILCTAWGVPNPDDKTFIAESIKKHKYKIEEKVINLCDLMCP